jgi:heme exporter protein C
MQKQGLLNGLAYGAMGLLLTAGTAATFLLPPGADFREPQLARILCFHLPCATLSSIFIFFGSYLSLRYLMSQDQMWDVRASAANSMGYLLSLLTMATGILFSKAQWGAWWQWDPRQTSYLLLLLVYAAYFALRAGFTDERRRAANSAAYSCVGAIAAFFLIFVFPHLPQVQQTSFHPSNTVVGGGLNNQYGVVVMINIVGVLVFCICAYRLQVRAGKLQMRAQEMYANLGIYSGNTAPTGVVRPVSIPSESESKRPLG